jgi:glycerophosphoryl diester phosphodiesterase
MTVRDAIPPVQSPEPEPTALKVLAGRRPLIIGHRGYCAVAPENTLPSFKLALEAGAQLVELDYRHSRDGVPMVIHDRTLDRTTNARRKWRRRRIRVADKSADEIQSLDAGAWFDPRFAGARVPRLTEALDFICGHGGIAVLEHKSGDARTCAGLLRERNLINRVVVISFDWAYLRAFHELEPGQALGALGPPFRLADGRRRPSIRKRLTTGHLAQALKIGVQAVVWNKQLSPAAVRAAHGFGLKICVYTINRPKPARRLLDMGVDGIITNRLHPIARLLESGGLDRA